MSALSAATLWREIASLHNGVDVDGLQIGQRLGALQPGQFDQLADHVGQPLGLGEHLLAEPAARSRGRRSDSSSASASTPIAADRGLQLVADVGHEVAAAGFHPGLLGLVVEVDHGEAGDPPRSAAGRARAPTARSAGRPALRGADRSTSTSSPVASVRCAAAQTRSSSSRSRTRPSSRARSLLNTHVAVGVDDHDADRRQRHHVLQHLRDGDARLSATARRCCARATRGRQRTLRTPTPSASATSATTAASSSHRTNTHAKIVRIG